MISLGNIDFNTEIPDGDGVIWYCRIEGWDDAPQRVNTVERPTSHGEITLDNKYAARQLTLIGTAVAEDAQGYWAAYHAIAAETEYLTVFTEDELLLIMEEDLFRQMRVLRTGIQRGCVDPDHILRFEVTLRADDPFKYDTDEKTLNTSGSAVNDGTARTYPTFELTAPGIPVLTADATVWSAVGTLPAGTVVDMAAMTVLDGTTNLMANVDPSSIWFPLYPGTTSLGSTVAGTWSWRDGYL